MHGCSLNGAMQGPVMVHHPQRLVVAENQHAASTRGVEEPAQSEVYVVAHLGSTERCMGAVCVAGGSAWEGRAGERRGVCNKSMPSHTCRGEVWGGSVYVGRRRGSRRRGVKEPSKVYGGEVVTRLRGGIAVKAGRRKSMRVSEGGGGMKY